MNKIILSAIVIIILLISSPYLSNLYYQANVSITESIYLIGEFFLVLFVINISFAIVEFFRLMIFAKALKINLQISDCIKAIFLNLFFGWLTPSAFLGAPASAYYLYKRGMDFHDSILLSFIRSFTIILTSSLTTIFIFSFGLEGDSQIPEHRSLMLKILIGIAIYIFILIGVSFLPDRILKRVNFIYKIATKLKQFFKGGVFWIPLLLCLSLITNFLLVSFIYYIGSSKLGHSIELLSQTYLYLSYMLLAPSPGATGLAEIGGPLFFGHSFPLKELIPTISAMRLFTFIFQGSCGLMVIIFLLKEKITFEKLKRFTKKSN